MTTMTIEVPDALMAQLVDQDRPVQEVIVSAAEAYFFDSPESRAVIRCRMRRDEGLSRAERVDRLIRLGIVRNPGEWDTAYARRWRNLPDDEKRRFIEETRAMFFADSPASSFIMANGTDNPFDHLDQPDSQP